MTYEPLTIGLLVLVFLMGAGLIFSFYLLVIDAMQPQKLVEDKHSELKTVHSEVLKIYTKNNPKELRSYETSRLAHW